MMDFIWRLFSGWLFRWIFNKGLVDEEQEFFENYLDLPPELRMMIIDRMRAEDRCRFTRCSKLCHNEAKTSKNYIYSLQFYAYNEDDINIRVAHGKYESDDDINYTLKFERGYIRKWIKCHVRSKDYRISLRNIELWREHLDRSTDLVEYSANYFKKLLKVHQNKIKHLSFYGSLFDTKLMDYDFEIEHLNNLEQLNINANMDVLMYFSKLRKPLKQFELYGKMKCGDLAENEMIYRIPDHIHMDKIKLTKEQFFRLSASVVYIHIGDFTIQDIFNFIRSWQNGEIEKQIRFFAWTCLDDSNFDANNLFRLLGLEDNDDEDEQYFLELEIPHFKEVGKRATLSCNFNESINFEVFDKS